MSTTLILVKVMTDKGPAMVPYAELDAKKMEEIPFNKALKHTVTQMRSVPHNRLYWAVLRLVVESGGCPWHQPEDLHKQLLISCGVIKFAYRLEQGLVFEADSIAFDAMRKPVFEEYFRKAMVVLCTDIMPGADEDTLIEEAKKAVKKRIQVDDEANPETPREVA